MQPQKAQEARKIGSSLRTHDGMMAQFELQIVEIPDAACFVDDAGDEIVKALYHSGCQAVLYESADSGTLRHKSFCQPLEGGQPTCTGQLTPILQRPLGPVQGAEREDGSELFLEHIGRCQRLVGFHESSELLLSAAVEIVPVAQDEEAVPLKKLAPSATGLTPLTAPDLVDGLVDIHHQVEAIINDVGIGKPLADGRLIGPCTVNAHRTDAGALRVAEFFKEGFHGFLLFALRHVQQLTGVGVEDDGDVAVALAHGFLVDEEAHDAVEAGRRGLAFEHDLVIATNGAVGDLEHGGDLGVGGQRGPRTHQPHEPPCRVAGGVDLLGTARHIALALRAQTVDGGEGQHDQGSVRHWAIHHDTPTDLVARESRLALGTTGAAALVELEIDLRANFLEGHLRNDIPPERGQGLDVTDFHTRSRPSRQGVCHPQFSRKSVMPRRRRAEKSHRSASFCDLCALCGKLSSHAEE